MATRQGSIDCLCGVYSVLNATEIVIGKYQNDRALKERGSQKRVLFGELVGYLAKKNKLEKALTNGISNINSRGGLIDIAIKSVKKHQKLKMEKQTAFDEDPCTLKEYWEKLSRHLEQEGSSALICLSGRREHWTCVKKITPKALILADSSGIKQIYRYQCTIGKEEKGMYTLWPTMTYLLSLE